jgi:hypothetical protein
VIALAAAVVVAFARPAVLVAPAPAPKQRLAISYDGPATAGVTYPDGIVTTGDPVFLRLVEHLDVGMRYAAPEQLAVRGTASLWVELTTASGWSARELLAQQDFDGGAQSLVGTVRLDDLAATIGAMSNETGTPATSAKVTLGATVDDATLEGRPVEPITSTIALTLGADSLTPLDANALVAEVGDDSDDSSGGGGALASVTTAAMTDDAPGRPTESGGVPRGWQRPLVLAFLAAVAAAALAWPTRVRSRVLPVGAIELSPQLTRIHMDDAMALEEIAAHEDVPVLAGDGWRAVIVEQRLYWDGEREPHPPGAAVPA